MHLSFHSDSPPSLNKNFLLLLALFVIPISGISTDIYVPSLPAVRAELGVDAVHAQMTVTAFVLSMGIVQLFSGSLSDSFGRRLPFLYAMAINILATFAIPFVHSIEPLIFLRAVQGVMVALLIVPMRAVIADLFEGDEYYKMTNYMVIAWSIGPIIAPAIGGYLQHYFGWRSNFYFLGGYSILGFAAVFFWMPDTSRYHQPFQLKPILANYRHILANPRFLIGLVIGGLDYSIMIIFAIVGPFLIQSVLHYTPIQFGHMALFMGTAWLLGGIINRFLTSVPILKKSFICFSAMWAVTVIALLLTFILPISAYLIVIPTFLLLLMGGIYFPSYFARSVALFPKITASANALFSGGVYIVAGLGSCVGAWLHATTEEPLLFTYLAVISVCIALYYVDRAVSARS